MKEIHARIPNTHLVMYGSSSVPQELLAIINQYGGKMKETHGVPVEEIQEAIKHGVRKINIDTDIRLGDDRRGAQVPVREPGQVRRPRMAQARTRRRAGPVQAALPSSSAAKARPARSGPQPAGRRRPIRQGDLAQLVN